MKNGESVPLTYEQKLVSGADRMARRMGGQFVRDERWDNVVRASNQANGLRSAIVSK